MCGWHEIESNFFEEVGYGQEMRWQFWKFLLHVLVAIKGKEIKEMMISTSIPFLLMIIFLWRYLRGNSDFLFQIYMLPGRMRIKKQRWNFSYLLLIFFFLVIKRTLKENFRYHNLPYSTYFSSTSFFGGDAFHAQKIHHEFYAFYLIIV